MAAIKIKTVDELKLMRPACAVAAEVLEEIGAFIKPGLTTLEVTNLRPPRSSAMAPAAHFWATANIRGTSASR